MKAWITEFDGIKSLVMAETRPKARWQTVKSAREAGYDARVTEVDSVRRIPCYDKCGLSPGRCHSIAFIKSLSEAAWDSYVRSISRRSTP
jgi:hypothetical protein